MWWRVALICRGVRGGYGDVPTVATLDGVSDAVGLFDVEQLDRALLEET